MCTALKQLSPDDSKINCNLGIAHYHQGRLSEAMAIFEQVIEKRPEMVTPYIYLSVIKLRIAISTGKAAGTGVVGCSVTVTSFGVVFGESLPPDGRFNTDTSQSAIMSVSVIYALIVFAKDTFYLLFV